MGVFETILRDGISRGHVPAKTQSARNWYRGRSKDFGATIRKNDKRVDYGRNLDKKMMREYIERQTTKIIPGEMYMYYYDPKFKDELPYYDRFPLIFPFRVKADRFWGINLHYLPLQLRAVLMDGLYSLVNNHKYDETTKLKMSYKALQSASRNKFFEPCVKQYLFSHTRSKFLKVHSEEWDVAIFLPVEKMTKATKSQVWAESKKKLGVSK